MSKNCRRVAPQAGRVLFNGMRWKFGVNKHRLRSRLRQHVRALLAGGSAFGEPVEHAVAWTFDARVSSSLCTGAQVLQETILFVC